MYKKCIQESSLYKDTFHRKDNSLTRHIIWRKYYFSNGNKKTK